VNHDLEALEIGEGSPLLRRSTLLCPCCRFPFSNNIGFLDVFLYDAGTSAAWKLWDSERCEGKVAIGKGLTRDASCWAVDNCLSITNEEE
jgi:hypothetical protein